MIIVIKKEVGKTKRILQQRKKKVGKGVLAEVVVGKRTLKNRESRTCYYSTIERGARRRLEIDDQEMYLCIEVYGGVLERLLRSCDFIDLLLAVLNDLAHCREQVPALQRLGAVAVHSGSDAALLVAQHGVCC